MSSDASGQMWKRYIFRGKCQHCEKKLAYGKVQKSLTKEKEWVICGPTDGCEKVVMVTASRDETEAASPPAGPVVLSDEVAEKQPAE